MGNLREHELHSAAALGLGFMPGEIHYCGLQSGNQYGFWRDNRRIPASRLHTTFPDAYDAVGRINANNNVVILSPDSHSLGASVTFNKNMTHLIGAYPGGRFSNRARFGMSTAFTPMFTVSGYGNLFRNIYSMHGTDAADLVGWLISGNRNTFEHVHFGGPMNAAQASEANYIGVHITGSENYFRRCTFGSNGRACDEASCVLKLAGGDNVFEDCIFTMQNDDADPYHVHVVNATSMTAHFINCKFIAFNANWATGLTKSFHFSAGATAGIYLDSRCDFINVDAIAAADKDQFIWLSRPFGSTTDTEGYISAQLSI